MSSKNDERGRIGSISSSVILKKPRPDVARALSTESSTDWRSIWVVSAIAFAASVQFSVYFSSLWPFLQEIDKTATEDFFGYITAIYSLGQALASPALGFWSNRIKQTKVPLLSGLVLMFIGNLLYGNTEWLPTGSRRYGMLLARFITGCGGGIIGVIRAYTATASSISDRSRAISINAGAFALGLTSGPAFQIAFTPIGYPGIQLGPIKLDMYTAPAYLACVMNTVGFICLLTLFKENYAAISNEEKLQNRFHAVPKFDKAAILVCLGTRFAQMFVITNLETIGSPYSMIMFHWTKSQAVLYNAIAQAGFGLIGFFIYLSYIVLNLGKILNPRIMCMTGLGLIFLFHSITFPWPFYSGHIAYRTPPHLHNGTWVGNSTADAGCNPDFDWCKTTPSVNVWLYLITYVSLIGLAFPGINISMNTLYSKIIGPRRQGTMQGLLFFSGSTARMLGPLFMASLFSRFGPRAAWGMELLVTFVCFIPWLVMYKRMVPLRSSHLQGPGDKYQNKHGWVERF
uniref:Major facilitator superfamily domain containing 8 n=1 Tax=Plectus sambesii TaxID=2011161 RepID=A0A914VXB3_9BILA